MRGIGGNQFIPEDSGLEDLMGEIWHGLRYLERYAEETGREIDYGAITVDTCRISTGKISVAVSGDLKKMTDV